MQISQRLIGAALLILGLSTPAMSQPLVPPPADVVSLSGPRVGFTVLSQSTVDTLKKDKQITVSPSFRSSAGSSRSSSTARRPGPPP